MVLLFSTLKCQNDFVNVGLILFLFACYETLRHQEGLYFIVLLAIFDLVSSVCAFLPPLQNALLNDLMRNERGFYPLLPLCAPLIMLEVGSIYASLLANITLCIDRCLFLSDYTTA